MVLTYETKRRLILAGSVLVLAATFAPDLWYRHHIAIPIAIAMAIVAVLRTR